MVILGPTYPFNQKSPASHWAILLLILKSDTKQTINLQVIYIDIFSNQLIDFQPSRSTVCRLNYVIACLGSLIMEV